MTRGWSPSTERHVRRLGPGVLALLVLAAPGWAQEARSASEAEVAGRALLMAAEAGRTDLVSFALDNGADVEFRDLRPQRHTALALAVEGGHHATVRLLLARGANPNAPTVDGRTPLMIAADARDDPLMGVELLGAGARVDDAAADGTTALMAAAGRGHENFVALLVLNRATVDAADHAGRTALLLASEDGSPESVSALLEAGADPNLAARNGDTSLTRAVIGTHAAVVSRLLAAGADVNAPAANGQTPLIIAVRTGDTGTVNTLLAAGADVNITQAGNGNSALMYAANSGFADLVEILLANGADVDARARDGWTAIEAAEMVGETGIVERLRAAARGG